MKTYTLFLIMLGCLLAPAHAQAQLQEQNIRKIHVDFAAKQLTTPQNLQDIQEGDYYRIIIKNINLNLWKISLNTKDTVLSKPLETLSLTSLELDAVGKLVASLGEGTSSVQPEIETDSAFLLPRDVVTNRLDEEKRLLSKLLSELTLIKGRIDELEYQVGLRQLAAYEDGTTLDESFDLRKALKEIKALREEMNSLLTEIKSKKAEYEEFSKENATAIAGNPAYTKQDKARKEAYSELLTALTALMEKLNAEKSIQLLKSIVLLQDKSGTYTSLPIQFKGDQAAIKLRIEPLKPEFNLPTYEMPLVFPLQSETYWSIGLSFYGSGLYDEHFSSVGVPVTDSTKTFSLVKEDDQKLEMGMATLLRFGKYLNDDKNIGFHGTFGPGISIAENVRPRVLLGAGFSFGQKHSFTVDAGVIAGHVERKSNAYEEESYSEKPENVTVSEIALSGFVALGYLFRF